LKGYGEVQIGNPAISFNEEACYDSLHMGQSLVDTVKVYNTGQTILRARFHSQAAWLVVDTLQKSIAAGDSLILPVTMNSAGQVPGDHSSQVTFTSNDPVRPSGALAMNMHIYAPDIAVAQTEIEGTVAIGGSESYPLIMANNGPGNLNYSISRMMFNGKSLVEELTPALPEGYRPIDDEKGQSSETEPFFGPQEKGLGGPDGWGYSWIDSDELSGPVYSWIDISAVGTEITGLGDDDSSAALPLGFAFPFYENGYTTLNIGSNGIITFGKGSTARTNTTFPNAAVPNNLIAIWWDDLDLRKGGHLYYYSDMANNRFIVSFVDVKNYYSTTGTGSLTFQAVLQSNGKILLQYGTMDPGSDVDGLNGASIGIENSNGTIGLPVVYNAAYMHNNLAISLGAANWLSVEPSAGTIAPFSSDTIAVGLTGGELEAGDYTGQLTINSNDPDSPSLVIPVTMHIGGPSYVCGDANGSGTVTILDVTFLLTFLYKGGAEPSPAGAGDANGNGVTNILDITYIIGYLYKGGPAPVCP